MRKKLFNHHKFRRNLSRHFRRASDDAAVYGASRESNPFRREKKISVWRKRLEVFILVVVLGVGGWYITCHSFFQITRVQIQGLERIPETQVREAIDSIMNYNIWFVLPGTSYVLVDADDMQEILINRFPLQSAHVTKEFPGTLLVNVEEKISTIIYDNGSTYSYLGLDGKVVEVIRAVEDAEWRIETKVTTTTLADGTVRTKEVVVSRTHVPAVALIEKQFGNHPILYDERKKDVEVNNEVLPSDIVAHAIAWFELLHHRTTIPFEYIRIEDAPQIQATIMTAEGWHIKIPLLEDPEEPFLRLDMVMKEVPRPRLEYVDVRYPEKVYWK